MKRKSHLPLTETVYYILLALIQPAHGYLIMQNVEELSHGSVRLAAGTLYGALETLLKKELIVALPSKDIRRKVYEISPLGKQVLQADCDRMTHMIRITNQQFGGEKDV